MVQERRVLVASNYNTLKYPFSAQAYEFCSVVAACEGADLLAPEATPAFRAGPASNAYLAQEIVRRGITRLRAGLGRPAAPTMQPTPLTRDYDLLFWVCQFEAGLAEVERLEGWRERCRTKVAFVVETWSTLMARNAANLR
ncbi:glycosyltransferase family 1 protein, partial [Salinarimonas soli]